MDDTIKTIFSVLIKVPIIVVVVYFIFNLFVFGLTYFKMLGVSYSAMQVAIENNYLPPSEKAQIQEMLTKLANSSSFVEDAEVYGNETRQQYGNTTKVGVRCKYKWVMPLSVPEQTVGGTGVVGNNKTKTSAFLDDSQMQQERDKNVSTNEINIEYEVPGLQYYPDLE